jgi:hypothetical protein
MKHYDIVECGLFIVAVSFSTLLMSLSWVLLTRVF